MQLWLGYNGPFLSEWPCAEGKRSDSGDSSGRRNHLKPLLLWKGTAQVYSQWDGLWVLDEANGTETLTSGVITGGTENHSAGNRGGISLDHHSDYIYNGTLNMYGGNVAGNYNTRGGGISRP